MERVADDATLSPRYCVSSRVFNYLLRFDRGHGTRNLCVDEPHGFLWALPFDGTMSANWIQLLTSLVLNGAQK